MSFSGVYMTDTNGNLGNSAPTSSESVTGLVFDISSQPDLWTKGYGATVAANLKDTVIELNSTQDAVDAGIIPFNGQIDSTGETADLLYGIPYYHINHFFTTIGGQGKLFVAFADCSQNWNALINMQKVANGAIYQIGVWTEQNLWSQMDSQATSYSVNLINDLNSVAVSLANNYHAPVSILLNANTAQIKTSSTASATVKMNKIPTCIVDCRYVTVLLGQALDSTVHNMQTKLGSCTPVGNIGAALGCVSFANVAESIGWVQKFNLVSYFPDIEFGFGDSTLATSGTEIADATRYVALNIAELESLDEKGYVFLMKHPGLSGTYLSSDKTCSDQDYRRLAFNRAINKSRRGVRTMLLPDVNSPIKVDPATGQLSAASITYFTNKIRTVLEAMVFNSEISGIGKIFIDPSQNILQNDQLKLQYSIIPIGSAQSISVSQGLALNQQ